MLGPAAWLSCCCKCQLLLVHPDCWIHTGLLDPQQHSKCSLVPMAVLLLWSPAAAVVKDGCYSNHVTYCTLMPAFWKRSSM